MADEIKTGSTTETNSGGDPTQAVNPKGEKAVSTPEPEQAAKTFTQAEALRKNLCKNNQPQKNNFVLRAADLSLYFLFQYKLNTAVCQAPDAKYPDFTALHQDILRRHQFSLSGYIISSSPSTLPQSRSGIVHFLDISVVAGYSALSSDVSLGNTLLCLFRRR